MAIAKLYSEKELKCVMDYLSKGDWALSQVLSWRCGVSSRQLRQMSEFTGKFLGSNEGYKRVDKAEKSEIQHAYNSLISRANKIRTRAFHLKYYL